MLVAGVLLYLSATGARIVARKYYVFLPGYLSWSLTAAPPRQGPVHLLVLFADHFEPDRQLTTTREWLARYRAMAARHRDVAGRPPQHTWFYPAEQFEPSILAALQDSVTDGLGEVEFHFHHDFDTRASLKERMAEALERFAAYGFNRTREGETRFAFVHGNFSLDNSSGPWFCGVNDELSLLREMGGFADLTFPSVFLAAQPPVVNTIYAARDDPGARSYATPLPLSTLTDGSADIMMLEGPLVFAPTLRVRRLFLELDDGSVHPGMPADPGRIPRWLRANVHVPGRPEWVFIKLFAHGASTPAEMDAVTGPQFDTLLSAFEREYNDGRRYVLHYVTARQAYNLAMAAADGRGGDPEQFLDYRVAPYVAGPRALVQAAWSR